MSDPADVVVVGAGSAGSVVAARLSEEPARRVALVEAGPDFGSDAATQPADVLDAADPTATGYDWGYEAESGIPLFAGRLVGGSSATNNVMALRGDPAVYDSWAAAGNPGWSFADVLPAFVRLERDLDFPTEPWHGDRGPIVVHRPGGAQSTFLHACEALGYEIVADHNAPGAVGAGRLPLNELDGVRQSTALTYLRNARQRPNLTLHAGRPVERVLVENGRAIGVQLRGGDRIHAGEVVLSAGAFGSPTLLLRSGIGPAGELAALGVPVHHDLPGVGRNLQDHPLLRLPFAAAGLPLADPPRHTLLTARTGRAGPPDIQVFPSGPTADDPDTVTLLVGLMTPRSRGALRLASADPADPPRIDPGHLRDPDDLARLTTGARLAHRLAATDPLAGHLTPRARSDEVLENAGSYQHPVGTCRMGPADDPHAVVDPAGRVHGIADLAVVDAAVMPSIPSANTNLPTLMLAERLAEVA
jgi:choline dehydrogenase